MKFNPRLALVSLLCLFTQLSLPVSGQTVGRISGTITDPSGAILPDVDVKIINNETVSVRLVKTDSNGFFVATALQIGTYRLVAEKSGFKRAERSGLTLVADGRLSVDFQLAVGDSTQSIDVVAETADAVNTVSGEISRVVDAEQVQNLALNGRNFIQLATLVPGSVITDADQINLTTSLSATTQNINGNRGNSTNQMVDGAYNLVAGSNGSMINNVGVDFIREVKIQSSNFSAEYGRNSGAAINVTTRSGSNQFHGGALEFFRNNALDARNFFSPTKPSLRFNDFGWNLGGPIQKNKLFFFVGQEWKKIRRDTQPARKNLPTSNQLSGNLSNLTAQLVFPGTTTPIPGNIIPASEITADGKAIAKVYEIQSALATSFTNLPGANNAVYQLSNPFNFREDIYRLDYNINQKHTLWGRHISDDFNLIDPLGTFSGNLLPTVPTNRIRPGKSWAIGWTWIVKPNLIIESRGSANWAAQRIPPAGENWKRSTYGFTFPQLFGGGLYPDGIPDVSIAGYTGFQGPSFALVSPSTDLQTTQTVSWIANKHVVKGGFTFFRDRIDQNGRPAYTGNVNFSTPGNPRSTGNALADALYGNFRTYSEASGDPMGFFRFSQYESFVQDNWRVTNRLSLEIGMRYQYGQPIYTQADNLVNFDPSLYDPAKAVRLNNNGTIVVGSGNRYNGLIRSGNGIVASELGRVSNATSPDIPLVPAGAPRGLYNGQHRFAPRFGFAYAVAKSTVLRGGYGLFYDRPEGNVIFSGVNTPPYLSNAQYENGNISAPSSGTASALAPFGQIVAIDPKLITPYSQQYSFGIQRQLPKSIFAELSYVGNLGRHLLREPDINLAAFADLSANAALPAAQQVSTNVLRPYSGFSVIRQYRSDSTSNYHALQFYSARRAGRVTGTFAYTWAKLLSDSSGNGDNPENYQNRHFSYGPATFDRTHVMVATSNLRLPVLKKSATPVKTAFGGWEISGIFRYQTGQALTPSGNTSIGGRRADVVAGASPYLDPEQRSVNGWIARGAFSPAPNDRFGNAGVGIVRGPVKQIFDMSLRKYIALNERIRLRIQADFFNALNITNFGNPNVNASDVNFGTITGADPGRNIQFGLKLNF
jgi:hypothetical protein